MKIVFVDPQSRGTLALYDYSLIRGIKNVEFYFAGNSSYDKNKLSNVNFNAIYNYHKKKTKFGKLLSYLFSLLLLTWYIYIVKPHLIHIQWLRLYHAEYVYYSLIKRIFKTPIVLTVHNLLPHDTGDKYRNIMNKMYRLCDALVVHCESTRHELVDQFHIDNSHIYVIPHGMFKFDCDEIEIKSLKKKFEEKYNLSRKIVFASIGAQNKYKGADMIVKAWNSLPILHNNKNIVLLFIGKNNGIDFSSLKEYNNVFVEDRYLEDKEFVALLQISDVLLLPYKIISQSGVLLSALNTNTPVLVSPIGGLTDPFKIASVGWILKSSTPNALKEYIEYLYFHPQDILKIKNNIRGWKDIHKYYDWQNSSNLTLDMYKNITNYN